MAEGVVRLGVLGCAGIAWRRTLPAVTGVPSLRVVAVASRDAGKADRFAARFGGEAVVGYERLLDRTDVDAVYLPLPTGLHHEWATRALAAGKHVLSEKPLATSLAEARALVTLARERGLRLMENFMFLYHSQHTAVRKLVADGVVGEPRVFSAAFGIPPLPDTDVRYRPELGGGALLDVGVYPIRAAQLFLGSGITVVGSSLNHGRGVDLAGSALLRDAAGVTAELSFGFVHGYRSTYALWGSDGRVSLDRAFTPPAEYQPVVRIEQQNRVEERTLPADHQFANIATAFARAVLDDAPPGPAEGDAILRQAALVDAVRAAAR
jgi:NDP-hexose-3-ketoreductase